MGDLDFQIILLVVAALVYGVGKIVEAAQRIRRRTREAERRGQQEERAQLEVEPAPAPAPPRRVIRPRTQPPVGEPPPTTVHAPAPAPAVERAPPARRRLDVRSLLRTRRGAQTAFVLAEVVGPPRGER